METVRLAPSMGVEVTDVDLRQVPDSFSLEDVERLFNEESMLLFRDQPLSPEEGRRFVGQFGPLVEGIGTVSNETATGRGELEFHSERSFQKEVPLRGLALQARRVTEEGGATLFVNCVAACRDLPDDLRAELEGVETVHQFDPRVRLGSAYGEGSEVPDGWLAYDASCHLAAPGHRRANPLCESMVYAWRCGNGRRRRECTPLKSVRSPAPADLQIPS